MISSFSHGPAHHHDLFNLVENRRLLVECRADIGQRPHRHERNRLPVCASQCVDNEVHSVSVFERLLRLDDVDAIDAGLAVYFLCGYQFPHHRLRAPGEDGYVAAAGDVAYLPCISFGERERNIAGNGRYPEDVELVRRSHRQQQADGIVLPGIAVEDDLTLNHAAL